MMAGQDTDRHAKQSKAGNQPATLGSGFQGTARALVPLDVSFSCLQLTGDAGTWVSAPSYTVSVPVTVTVTAVTAHRDTAGRCANLNAGGGRAPKPELFLKKQLQVGITQRQI